MTEDELRELTRLARNHPNKTAQRIGKALVRRGVHRHAQVSEWLDFIFECFPKLRNPVFRAKIVLAAQEEFDRAGVVLTVDDKEDLMSLDEDSYLEGRRSAQRELLSAYIRAAYPGNADVTPAQALLERSEADSALRALHRDMGGAGDWVENLHLGDVVEKYIRRQRDWTRNLDDTPSELFKELREQVVHLFSLGESADPRSVAEVILHDLAKVLGPVGQATRRTWLNTRKGPYAHPRGIYPEAERVRVRVGPLCGVVVGEFIAYDAEGNQDGLDPRWGWPVVHFDLICCSATPHPALFSVQRASEQYRAQRALLGDQPAAGGGPLNLVMPCDPGSVELLEP